MVRYRWQRWLFAAWAAAALFGCEKKITNPGDDGPALEATFSSIQTQVFQPSCVNVGCHPGGGAPFSLQSDVAYQNLVNRSSPYNMPRVKPGDADSSALYHKVLGSSGFGRRMPLGGNALSAEKINAIRDWINAGAKND